MSAPMEHPFRCYWEGCDAAPARIVATIGGTRWSCEPHADAQYTRMFADITPAPEPNVFSRFGIRAYHAPHFPPGAAYLMTNDQLARLTPEPSPQPKEEEQ